MISSHPAHVRGAESPRKVLQVLLSFNEQRPHATISELADVVGVPLSTCYRYVGLLREVGLLEEGERATYHVTPQIMHVARAAQVSNKLSQLARPYLQRISAQVSETALLMQPFGPIVVCVESVSANRTVRLVFEPGHSMPLGSGASGKLLLAYMSARERSGYLAQRAENDPNFAAKLPAIDQELPILARQGWASSLAEVEDGVWACAAPIRHGAHAVATMSVAGPAFRIEADQRETIRELLIDAAAEVSVVSASYG